MVCQNCHKEVKEDNNFCEYCGHKIVKEGKLYCTNCGQELINGNNFCTNCGSPVHSNTKVEKEEPIKKEVVKLVKPKIDPEIRKLDILLKIGSLMVVIAGLVLATSNTLGISNILKCLIIGLLSAFFFGMYFLSKNKIKIKSTNKIYWKLGALFVEFTLIAIGYFKIISPWFAFGGEGENLFICCLFALGSLLEIISYKEFYDKSNLYLSMVLLTFAAVFLLIFFDLGCFVIFALINILLTVLFILLKNKKIFKNAFNIAALINIFIEIITILIVWPEFEIIPATLLAVTTGISMIFMSYNNDNKVLKILNGIITPLFFLNFLMYSLDSSYLRFGITSAVLMLLLVILLLFHNIVSEDQKDLFIRMFKAVTLGLIFGLALNSYIDLTTLKQTLIYKELSYYYVDIMLSSLVALTCSIVCNYEKVTNKKSIYEYLFPLGILSFVNSVLFMISNCITTVSLSTYVLVYSIILIIMYYIINNKNVSKISYLLAHCLILFGLTLIPYLPSYISSLEYSSVYYNENFVWIFNIISELLYLLITMFLLVKDIKIVKNNNDSILFKWCLELAIVTSALSPFYILTESNIFNFDKGIASLISLFVYIILLLYFFNNKKERRAISLGLLLPVLNYANYSQIDKSYLVIIVTSAFILSTYIFSKTFSKKVYNILLVVLLPIILFIPTCMNLPIVGVYIGIVSIALIIFDILNKNIRGLFEVGICYTILNILIQLSQVWSKIPYWAYLLFAGLAIIIFVTFLLIKGEKNAKKEN